MILTNWQKNKAMKLTNLLRGLAVWEVQAGRSKAAVAQSFNVSAYNPEFDGEVPSDIQFLYMYDVTDRRNGQPCVNFAQLVQITMQERQALPVHKIHKLTLSGP